MNKFFYSELARKSKNLAATALATGQGHWPEKTTTPSPKPWLIYKRSKLIKMEQQRRTAPPNTYPIMPS
jgi:hypothetical protein